MSNDSRPASPERALADDMNHEADAIRLRIALAVAAFSQPTAGLPDAMTPEEAAAALGMTNADIEALDKLLAFAVRWGVSLDWLLAGRVEALLRDARMGRIIRDGRDA